MATPAQIRQAVDDRLASLWAAIQNKQANYYATNGKYWQGLKTHVVTPADGATATPTIGTATPTDQPDPWPLAIRNAAMEMALQIDCYSGPQGDGYQATVWVTINAETWTRRAQVGPETWRTFGWTRMGG